MRSSWLRAAVAAAVVFLAACEGPLAQRGASGVITGRVLDALSGAPVAGVEVGTEPDVGRATTGADGRYAITGVPLGAEASTVLVTATRAGLQPASAAATLSLRRPRAVVDLALVLVDVAAGDGVVRVRVTDLGGRAVAGALVRAFDGFGRARAVGIADARGEILLALTPGPYTLRAQGTGELVRLSSVAQIEVVARGDTTLAIALGRFELRATADVAARPCLGSEDTARFAVEVRNAEGVVLPEVVIHDTLDASFTRGLEPGDIVVDRERFPQATVILDPSGFSFSVRLGALPPSADWVEAFTIALPLRAVGVLCQRATGSARISGGVRLLAEDRSCAALRGVLELDVEHDDGDLDPGGAFRAEKEVFRVGDGGPARPDDLVYRLVLRHGCPTKATVALTSLEIVDRVAPGTGLAAFREVVEGFPTVGRLVASDRGGFTWRIDKLLSNQEAEIRFRAEALAPGEAVNRIEATATELAGTVVHEEPTTIAP